MQHSGGNFESTASNKWKPSTEVTDLEASMMKKFVDEYGPAVKKERDALHLIRRLLADRERRIVFARHDVIQLSLDQEELP